MQIILASSSFLRNFILEKSQLTFRKEPSDIDESVYDDQPIADRVVSLARAKCKVVAKKFPNDLIISCDTLTTDAFGHVSQKPKPDEDLFERAMQLSGKTIEVYTGYCFYNGDKKSYTTELARATITYQKFSKEELHRLAEVDNPNIRGGGLGIFFDAPGFTLIEHIEGSYSGAFGLPMEFVYRDLRGKIS